MRDSRPTRLLTIAIASALLVLPAALHAQPRDWPWARGTVGASGGVSLPVASLTDVADPGWHAQLSWISRLRVVGPATLRVDAQYADFGTKSETGGGTHLWSVTGNLVAATMPRDGVRFYTLAGAGAYYVSPRIAGDDPDARDDRTTLGINAGLGLDVALGQLGLFAEARWHWMPGALGSATFELVDAAYMVPVTIGVRF